MKNLLFLLCFCCSVALTAQSSKQSLSVVENDDFYSFSIKLDRDRGDELSSAYLKLITQQGMDNGVAKIVGTAETETPNGTRILLNTKRATLKVLSAENNASSLAEAKRYTAFLRQELKASPAPAPPAPPKVH